MTAIQDWLDAGDRSPAAVGAFLDAHEFPLAEGRQVTFTFRGQARRVFVQHWIQALPQQQPFVHVPGTDLWYLTMDLPENSRIEYKLGVDMGMGLPQLIQDPLNEHLARDPFGANSVIHTEGYVAPDWAEENDTTRPGTLEHHTVPSAAFGGDREVQVYLPARYRPRRRYPLLVVHDGDDFLRFADLKVVLDNLIHRLEIQPMVCALTTSHDRLVEYANDERHSRFLVDELVPFVESQYSIRGQATSRGVLGASFGAIASLSAAWRNPGVFGRMCLLSGSFLFTDIGEHEGGPAFDPVVDFMNAFRADPGRPARQLYQSCGVYEPMITYNRSMVPVFQSTGMRVRFVEARDGHNWQNWRDRLREALSWLFPGPLWMVYE